MPLTIMENAKAMNGSRFWDVAVRSREISECHAVVRTSIKGHALRRWTRRASTWQDLRRLALALGTVHGLQQLAKHLECVMDSPPSSCLRDARFAG